MINPPDPRLVERIALQSSAIQNAFAILTKCLLNNGALKPGQFSAALKTTINDPDANWDRQDYVFFQLLANLLDEVEAQDRGKTD
jgi:hypothetical protein